MQGSSTDFAMSIECDVEQSSQGHAVMVLTPLQLSDILADSQLPEMSFSSQLYLTASLVPGVVASGHDSQVMSMSPASKQHKDWCSAWKLHLG